MPAGLFTSPGEKPSGEEKTVRNLSQKKSPWGLWVYGLGLWWISDPPGGDAGRCLQPRAQGRILAETLCGLPRGTVPGPLDIGWHHSGSAATALNNPAVLCELPSKIPLKKNPKNKNSPSPFKPSKSWKRDKMIKGTIISWNDYSPKSIKGTCEGEDDPSLHKSRRHRRCRVPPGAKSSVITISLILQMGRWEPAWRRPRSQRTDTYSDLVMWSCTSHSTSV